MLRRTAGILKKLAFYPKPIRLRLARELWKRLPFASYSDRLNIDAVERPHYGYCLFHAALQAKALNHTKISVVEFGVAGGNGLVNIEYHVGQIQKELDIEFEVYGFDTTTGLPPPKDYRDLPYHWKEGCYTMDLPALRRRLKFATLVIGDVNETVDRFIDQYHPAPIGCCFFDLDYYSSTRQALRILNTPAANHLPRVLTYFDDIIADGPPFYNDYTGELLAIREFNDESKTRKIAKLNGLSAVRQIHEVWNDQIYVFHDFDHPSYNAFISPPDRQLALLPE